MQPKEIVRQGYDTVSYAYRHDTEDEACTEYHRWLDALIPLLSPGDSVLELGCGCGVPVAKRLAREHSVVGIDLSSVQVARARQLVPAGEFHCIDMTEADFPSKCFTAVISFYAIIHVPLDEQRSLFRSIAHWLKPGGYFMATLGKTCWEGAEENWLGVDGATMYWSHADAATYEAWLAEDGFSLRWTEFIPEGDGGHHLVLARKQSGEAS